MDLVRNVDDPITASKLLVDHALNRFSTDNLSCMIVRLDHDQNKEIRADVDAVRAADKIANDTAKKTVGGSIPIVGVSTINNSTSEGDFVPTSLDEAVVEEEPDPIDDKDNSRSAPDATQKKTTAKA